ncbi:response regulator transcription factor [Companilactobacillus sp. HBUAS56275]|uniref:response regulator transcription factor n=1 Tax=Companilactobacillus sp. HBUAS56275 TaxID=3109364 RepID=UPI002FEFBE4F
MFSIYLFEDNDSQREYYKNIINNIIMINDYSIKLIETSSVESFNRAFVKEQYGLFFLDMEVGDDIKAGLKIAENVRKKMQDAKIVFLTTHEELSFLTLERKISPMDYILKDNKLDFVKKRIIQDIELAKNYYVNSLYQREKIFGYKIGSRYFSVPMKEVVLLYTKKQFPGKVSLEADSRSTSFPGNLNLLESKYNNLLRVDKSYLINKDRVVSYDLHNRILYLDNNIQCNVSYRRSSEVSNLFK